MWKLCCQARGKKGRKLVTLRILPVLPFRLARVVRPSTVNPSADLISPLTLRKARGHVTMHLNYANLSVIRWWSIDKTIGRVHQRSYFEYVWGVKTVTKNNPLQHYFIDTARYSLIVYNTGFYPLFSLSVKKDASRLFSYPLFPPPSNKVCN